MTLIVGIALIYTIVQLIILDRKIEGFGKKLDQHIEYMEKQQRYKDFIASRVKDKF
jgi:hypothetical protein